MRTLYTVLLLSFALMGSQRAQAQGAAATCDGSRYAADVFTAVTQTTGITYGQNTVRDYSTGTDTPTTLQLDFYEPSGDGAAQRPLVIFAFGGSFVSGRRQDMDDLCQAFARKGYATATIDYRLVPAGAGCPSGFPNCNQLAVFSSRARLADQIVRASSDMKAAVRFFRRYATTYRIDPTRIIVAGYSAGAITALQTAYLDSETEDSNYTAAYQANGGLEGNTDLPAPDNLLPTYNARDLAGAFSLAGAVARLSVVGAANPPLYAAHGDADQVVPYGRGTAFGTSTYTLYGGGALHARADSIGLANQLYTVAGGDHASTRQEPSRTAITTAAAAFFQEVICRAPLPVVLAGFTGRAEAGTCAATLTWRTASEVNSRQFDVQASRDGRQFATLGTMPSQNRLAGASYTFRTPALAAGAQYFRLRLLDADGTATYGPVLTLVAACAAPPLVLAPNPARDQVLVSGLPAGPVQVLLYNALGQIVSQSAAAGSATLPLAGLAPGIYLLQVVDTGGVAHRARLVKE